MPRSELNLAALGKFGNLLLASPSAAALYQKVWDQSRKRKEINASKGNESQNLPIEVFEDSRMRVNSSGVTPKKNWDSEIILQNKRGQINPRGGKSSLESLGYKKPNSLIYNKSETTNLSLSDKRAIRDMVKGFYKDSGKIISGDSILSAMKNRNVGKMGNQEFGTRDFKACSSAADYLPKDEKYTERVYQLEAVKPHSDQDISKFYPSRPPYEFFRRYNVSRNWDSKKPAAASTTRIGSVNITTRQIDVEHASHLLVVGNPEKSVRIQSSKQTVANYPKTDAVELSQSSQPKIAVKRLHIPNHTHLPTRIRDQSGDGVSVPKLKRRLFSINA